MKNDIYQILISSFDRQLSEKESRTLEMALREDAGLRAEKLRLEQIRNLISSRQPDFEPFFETRVMAGIENIRELFSDQLYYVFRRFAFASLLIIAAFLVGSYMQYGSLSLNAMAGLSELNQNSAETFLLYGWDK